ncbi:MAG: AsmA family protein [Micropepsaceae bacterium]
MRKILGISAAILGVLLLILIALPFLIPMESYRGPIADAASNATGRVVQIDGDLRLTIYPELGVSVGDVSVSNAEGAREPLMVSIGNLVVGVRVMPLLSGNIEVARLVLDEPVIHLEVARDGTPNWDFSGGAEPAPEAEAGGQSAMADRINDFGIAELRISDGHITYYDAGADSGAALEDVDIALSMPSTDSPMNMEGALTYNNERFEIDVDIARPRALLEDETTAAQIALESNLVNASFDGTIAASGETSGSVDLNIPSLRNLAGWSGSALPPGDNLGALDLEADMAAQPNRVAFSGLRMTLDGMTITGDLSIDASNPILMLSGGMAIDRLDFNNYLTTSEAGADAGAAPAAGGGYSDAPLQLDLLKTVNADLTLVVGTLLFQSMTIEQAALGARLDNGLLNAELREMSLYGGSGTGTLVINAREATPSFRTTMNISGTDVQAFLTDFMNIDRVSGTGAFNFDLNTRGSTPNQIVNALAGSGNIDFQNGALRGVDLGAVARTLETVINLGGAGNLTSADSATEFTAFGGSFVMQNGIAHNDDFLMDSPVIRVIGNGDLNLAAQTMDFHIEPQPVAIGNVAGVDLGNIGVPFRVSGPWNDLSYTPDLASLLPGVIEGVIGGALGEGLGGLGGLGGALGGLLGGQPDATEVTPQQDPAEEGETQNPLNNPEDAIRSLFGGFGGQ